MDVSGLPHLQAGLNALSALLLSCGFVMIRRGEKHKHKFFMVSALISSSIFLVSYITYHLNTGHFAFAGVGTVRVFYFTLLAVHVIAAAVNLPMIIVTVLRALRGDFSRHKKIARWTFSIWMFVSVSGVVVYLMAFHIYAPNGGSL